MSRSQEINKGIREKMGAAGQTEVVKETKKSRLKEWLKGKAKGGASYVKEKAKQSYEYGKKEGKAYIERERRIKKKSDEAYYREKEKQAVRAATMRARERYAPSSTPKTGYGGGIGYGNQSIDPFSTGGINPFGTPAPRKKTVKRKTTKKRKKTTKKRRKK